MTTARASIIRGPAALIFGGNTYFTEGDINVNLRIETFEIASSVNGKEDERYSNIMTEISFTPIGTWAQVKALLNPFASPVIGSSLFGSSDTNLVIHTKAGRKETWQAAALTGLPNVRFSSTKTLLEGVTITCVGKNNTEWSDASKRVVEEAEAFAATPHDPSERITQAYDIAWGADAPYNDMESEDGVSLAVSMSTQPVTTDRDGIVDMTLEGIEVAVRFVPVGLSEAQLFTMLKIQGAGVVRGASLGAVNAKDLVISGTGVYAAIYGAAPKEGPLRFGRTVLRVGEVAFVATRQYDDGVLEPLFLLADAAPE